MIGPYVEPHDPEPRATWIAVALSAEEEAALDDMVARGHYPTRSSLLRHILGLPLMDDQVRTREPEPQQGGGKRKPIKLRVNRSERNYVESCARETGYPTIRAYVRALLDLGEIHAGAPIGNQNLRGAGGRDERGRLTAAQRRE